MPTNILDIQPREQNFRTQANADWLDGLLIWQAGAGGVVAGAANAGNGALTVASVAASTALGAHIVTVTSLDGVPRITAQDPAGNVTARGVVGLPLFAGGVIFTVSSGSKAFAVGDTFAVGVLPVPIDIAGIQFDLQLRSAKTAANVRLTATSRPTEPSIPATIAVGTQGGQIALRVLSPALSPDKLPVETYVYDIIASADGLKVPAFFGTVEHVAGVTHLR